MLQWIFYCLYLHKFPFFCISHSLAASCESFGSCEVSLDALVHSNSFQYHLSVIDKRIAIHITKQVSLTLNHPQKMSKQVWFQKTNRSHKGSTVYFKKNTRETNCCMSETEGEKKKPNLLLQADSSGRAKIIIRHGFKSRVKFWPNNRLELNNKMGDNWN